MADVAHLIHLSSDDPELNRILQALNPVIEALYAQSEDHEKRIQELEG